MNILVLSPHADDAEIGAGGTIVRLNEKNNIFWMVFCPYKEPLSEKYNKEIQIGEFNKVVDFLKIDSRICNYEVRRLDKYRKEILDELIEVKKFFNPDMIIGPSLSDFHQDHQVIANEMVRAFKTSASIISYEIPWNFVNFNTQIFFKLSQRNIEWKIRMMKYYKSQMEVRPFFFNEELVRGMAAMRGSQINTRYAEAFEVIRWIQ